MNTLTLTGYIIVGVSLILVLIVGYLVRKKVKKPDDFYVAGRGLSPLLLMATLTATNVNLYSVIGQAGKAYQWGTSIIWQTWTGNMALVLAAFFVLPIMRRLRIRTVPELLEMRFGYPARAVVSLLWVFRLLCWLGIALYAAVLPIAKVTGLEALWIWVLVLGGITTIYTCFGGMWSVAVTDAIQLVLMWGSLLILFFMSMGSVGWFAGLSEKLPAQHLDTIIPVGDFNWLFVFVIFLLGIQWACTDQGMLQRAFGARDTRGLAKGMVFAAIITTPMAVLWVGLGLASRVLHPGLSNADEAVPTLLSAAAIPQIVFAFIVVGFLAAQMSTASANLNASTTLFCSDIYERVLNRKASVNKILFLARVLTLVFGAVMMLLCFLLFFVAKAKGIVDVYLTLIGIMDMPLFVVAIVYGLLWRRANLVGAIGGYFAGAAAGVMATFGYNLHFGPVALISAGVALLACPLLSLLTKHPDEEKVKNVWEARTPSEEEKITGKIFHIWPISTVGKISLLVLFVGLGGFLLGTFSGAINNQYDSLLAISGMVVFFIGAILRVFCK